MRQQTPELSVMAVFDPFTAVLAKRINRQNRSNDVPNISEFFEDASSVMSTGTMFDGQRISPGFGCFVCMYVDK